jgi:hypothetical protein
MRKLIASFLVIGAAGIAYAGYKTTYLVSVDAPNRTAYGSMGDARASSDSLQYIGCSYAGYSTYGSGTCNARNSAGQSVYCYTSDAPMLAAIASVNDGYLYFQWDANGKCTYIYSSNSSNNAQKY